MVLPVPASFIHSPVGSLQGSINKEHLFLLRVLNKMINTIDKAEAKMSPLFRKRDKVGDHGFCAIPHGLTQLGYGQLGSGQASHIIPTAQEQRKSVGSAYRPAPEGKRRGLSLASAPYCS